MKAKRAYLIIFFLFAGRLFAQIETPFEKDLFKDRKDEFNAAMDEIKTADEILMDIAPHPMQAVEHYLKAYKFNPNSAELNYKIAKCYLQFDKYEMKAYFEKAYQLKPTIAPDLLYWVGYSHHLNSDWKVAQQHYNSFIAKATDPALAQLKNEAMRRILECKSGEALADKKARVWIDNLGPTINTKYPEYAPVISTDETFMVFTARKPDNEILSPYGGHFEDMYQSTHQHGRWLQSTWLGKPVNVQGQHDATIGMSPDGHILYVYNDKKGGGDIYSSLHEGGVWTEPQRLGKTINTDYHEPDASLSFDGNRLYFTSDKPGGLGEHDIYYSDWDDDKSDWGEAVNVGNIVNTQYAERSVFIHPDGETMYFSSQGHNSMGGFDLFYSKLVDGKWQKPINLGPPLNTPDDDIQLVVAGNGRYGYYSSYRSDGYGEKDIYLITFLGPQKQPLLSTEDNLIASIAKPVKEISKEPVAVVEGANLAILTGIIRDEKTKLPLKAEIVLVDNTANKVIAEFVSDGTTGKYLVSLPGGANYGIAVKKEGYLFHSENFVIPSASGFKQYNKDADLKKVEVGQTIILRNIFFDLDKFTLRPESVAELERLHKLLVDNPTMKIEISGHTDTRGSDDHNQELSQNRAKAVVDYLISKGVVSSRMQFAGYGETKVLMTDTEISKITTATGREDAHQQNRRTEFKIISM